MLSLQDASQSFTSGFTITFFVILLFRTGSDIAANFRIKESLETFTHVRTIFLDRLEILISREISNCKYNSLRSRNFKNPSLVNIFPRRKFGKDKHTVNPRNRTASQFRTYFTTWPKTNSTCIARKSNMQKGISARSCHHNPFSTRLQPSRQGNLFIAIIRTRE